MTAYALTSKIGSDERAIVNLTTGDRFEFPPEDGPMLAEMLDGEFPACESCEDRESKCAECGRCSDCDDDEPACWACPDYQDDEDDDEDCDHGGSPGVTTCQHCAPGEEVTQ